MYVYADMIGSSSAPSAIGPKTCTMRHLRRYSSFFFLTKYRIETSRQLIGLEPYGPQRRQRRSVSRFSDRLKDLNSVNDDNSDGTVPVSRLYSTAGAEKKVPSTIPIRMGWYRRNGCWKVPTAVATSTILIRMELYLP